MRTRQRERVTDETLSSFMGELELVLTGGRWATVARLKKQTARRFASMASCIDDGSQGRADVGYRLADRTLRWWSVCQQCRSSTL